MNIISIYKRVIKYSIFITTIFVGIFFQHTAFAAVPSAIKTLAGTPDATSVALTWTAPSGSGITDYTIQYRLNGTSSWSTFVDGTSTTATAVVTGLTADTTYDFSVMAVNSDGTAAISNVVPITTGYIFITTPMKGVAGAPLVATCAMYDDYTMPFYVPYIQTSTTLSVTASVAAAGLPSSGGVKFVLNEGLASEQITYDMSSPFTVSFTSLAKAEYTLDAYIVDSSQVVQSGSINHDEATDIGIGDIFVAMGDSITEGYYDTDLGTTPIVDWTSAPAGTVSADYRQFPQHGSFGGHWRESFLTDLQDTLVSYYGYPVFIMNDGRAAITSAGFYSSYVNSSSNVTAYGGVTYQQRITALGVNKYLINLGVNDAYTGRTISAMQTSMQQIITKLTGSYGATAANIWLAYPNYSFAAYSALLESYQPTYTTLISNNSLSAGPDLWTFFKNHYSDGYHYDVSGGDQDVHPNETGFDKMSELYQINLITPRNLATSQASGLNGAVTFTWDSLNSIASGVDGYRLSYGTVSGTYTATADFTGTASGTVASGTFTHGTTYYVVVKVSDTDAYSPNYSPNSSEISFTFRGTPLAPIVTGVSGVKQVSLSWPIPDTGGSSISDYIIEYKTSSSPDWGTYSDGVSTALSATIESLSQGQSYDFRVTAVNANGNGVTSDVVSVTPSAPSISGSYISVNLRPVFTNTPTVVVPVEVLLEKPICKLLPPVKSIKYGAKNTKSTVLLLKEFLNTTQREKLNMKSATYDRATESAVKRFQLKYAKEILYSQGLRNPTGAVYTATWKKIREISCI